MKGIGTKNMPYYEANKNPNFWKNSNDEIRYVNCGSYAFNILDWYWPYDRDESYGDDIIASWDNLGSFGEALEDSTNRHLIQILNDFNDVRVIQNFNEAKNDERIILYREGVSIGAICAPTESLCEYDGWEWDFHFIWRDTNGFWHEKLGGDDIRIVDEPTLSEPWQYNSLAYQGPIVMLAKKENDYETV